MADTKQAEKEYLRRASTAAWERSKPFSSSPGTAVPPEEAADLIHDFAVMLRMLSPRSGDLILDLGSGGCWVSEWLSRLELFPVSLDIAFDMLQVGRSRLTPGRGASQVVGDMESLPFASETFDHACCMSAIHHVPSIPTALREICRVVRPEGRVAFLEPGAGHSALPHSQAAMRDFGVLEQDLNVTDFMAQCSEAGFADVQVLPLSYVDPRLALTRDQYQAWRRQAETKRPLRATAKMWRAIQEFFGLGKDGTLMEESFTIRLARIVGDWTVMHPVVLAHRSSPAGPRDPIRYRSAITVLEAPTVARAGDRLRIRVATENTGNARWHASLNQPQPTRVGVQLLAADGSVVERDFARGSLPHQVPPGSRCEAVVEFCAPSAGTYCLKIDMVTEGITWFEPNGSPAVSVPLEVA